jgi:hypothetical protein
MVARRPGSYPISLKYESYVIRGWRQRGGGQGVGSTGVDPKANMGVAATRLSLYSTYRGWREAVRKAGREGVREGRSVGGGPVTGILRFNEISS